MMKNRHYTPGPWHAQCLDEENGVWMVPEPFVVATSEGDTLNEANARLIACAPDLLAACKVARSALDTLMGDSDLQGDDSPEFVAMQMLSAAIDKAEDWPISQQYEGKGS